MQSSSSTLLPQGTQSKLSTINEEGSQQSDGVGPTILRKKNFDPQFLQTQTAIQDMYLKNKPRISLSEDKDNFIREKFEELLEIDLSDVENTVVLMTRIGLPGWKMPCSINELLTQEKLSVETIHLKCYWGWSLFYRCSKLHGTMFY